MSEQTQQQNSEEAVENVEAVETVETVGNADGVQEQAAAEVNMRICRRGLPSWKRS